MVKSVIWSDFAIRDLREIFVKQYRVIYKIEEKQIVIHGVIHMSQDFEALKKNYE
jgi:hypothetical protein